MMPIVSRDRALVWLHRIGYVATIVVLAELVLAAMLLSKDVARNRRIAAEVQARTAYHDGPLLALDQPRLGLEHLPSSSSLAPDGVRFLAGPSLRPRKYAVALRLRPRNMFAEGLLVTTEREEGEPEVVRRTAFRLTPERYRRLTSAIDHDLDGFKGSDALLLDGTSLAFERVRGTKVTAGSANTVPPYAALSELLLETIRPALPHGLLPPPHNEWWPKED